MLLFILRMESYKEQQKEEFDDDDFDKKTRSTFLTNKLDLFKSTELDFLTE